MKLKVFPYGFSWRLAGVHEEKLVEKIHEEGLQDLRLAEHIHIIANEQPFYPLLYVEVKKVYGATGVVRGDLIGSDEKIDLNTVSVVRF